MKRDPRQLYGVVAVLALIVSILNFLDRDWLRGASGLFLAGTMAIAATGFPERSVRNKRIYYGLLAAVIVLMIFRIVYA